MWRFLLLFSAITACDQNERTRSHPSAPVVPATPSAVAEKLKLDASLEIEADPLVGPPGDLQVEASAFVGIDACAKKHAPTDPILVDAIDALGYETLLRDTCRTLEALKNKNIDACKPIEVQRTRARCESTVAMALALPDRCPALNHDEGHDPLCLAIASRTPALCAAADTFENRVMCEVTLLGAKAPYNCNGLATGPKARCERFSLRLRGYMGETKALTLKAPEFRLTLEPEDGSGRRDTDLSRDVARGVVVMEDHGKLHVQIGRALHEPGTLYVPSAAQRARLSLTTSVPKALGTGVIDHLELEAPGHPSYVVPTARCDCKVSVLALGTTRGSDVELDLSGSIGVPPNVFKLQTRIKTFVRDFVSTAER